MAKKAKISRLLMKINPTSKSGYPKSLNRSKLRSMNADDIVVMISRTLWSQLGVACLVRWCQMPEGAGGGSAGKKEYHHSRIQKVFSHGRRVWHCVLRVSVPSITHRSSRTALLLSQHAWKWQLRDRGRSGRCAIVLRSTVGASRIGRAVRRRW